MTNPNLTNTILTVALLFIASLGCKTMTEGKPAAEKAVTRFHQMLADEKYAEIYRESSQMMKDATSEEDMIKIFRIVNSKLGKVTSTQNQSWRVGNFNLTSTVQLVQATQFEKGKGTEDFVFEIEGADAKLAGYHVNSMDLFSE